MFFFVTRYQQNPILPLFWPSSQRRSLILLHIEHAYIKPKNIYSRVGSLVKEVPESYHADVRLWSQRSVGQDPKVCDVNGHCHQRVHLDLKSSNANILGGLHNQTWFQLHWKWKHASCAISTHKIWNWLDSLPFIWSSCVPMQVLCVSSIIHSWMSCQSEGAIKPR